MIPSLKNLKNAFQDKTEVVLPLPIETTKEDVISNTYRIYKAYIKNKKYSIREGQQRMIKFIDQTFNSDSKSPILVEAGTGTGKTISYSIPAIAHGIQEKKKVIIATATVALQSQILDKDLPDILENSSLDFKFVAAKGRSHFACPIKLIEHEQESPFKELLDSVLKAKWNGEKDDAPISIASDDWSKMLMDKNACKGKQCEQYDKCPYYKARAEIKEANVIVTNHAFLLSDLAMGGGVLLHNPEDTIYCIDEFHGFVESARKYFAKKVSLRDTFNESGRLSNQLNEIKKGFKAFDMDSACDSLIQNLKSYQSSIKAAYDQLKVNTADIEMCEGEVEPFLQMLAQDNHRNSKAIVTLLNEIDAKFRSDDIEKTKELAQLQEAARPILSEIKEMSETGLITWACYSRNDREVPLARWIKFHEDEVTVSVSPITPSRALKLHLWDKAYRVVGASATITVDGSFKRIEDEIGCKAETLQVPSPFDYEKQAVLEIKGFRNSPNAAGFEAEVINYLNSEVNPQAGTLVIFTSMKQMRDVADKLRPELKEILLMQGSLSKRAIISKHNASIWSGKGSMIFGVDSFSEGVDLQGDALTHLICVKIKFDIPNDPISKTAHWFYKKTNRNPFNEIEIPKATIRLVQTCGRLIRTEKDSGKITLLDNRLIHKGYGKTILNSLPMKVCY